MPDRRSGTAALGLVYDTGALIAAENNDRRMWALHARALWRGVLPIVPAGCVVEAWSPRPKASLARLLDGCDVEALKPEHARRAGALLRSSAGVVGAVDATVVESALRRGAAVVTTDRSDIETLAMAARRRIQIIDL